jgi:uncharacterized RDD family membrane protein YckC
MEPEQKSFIPAGILRRFGALLYDSLLLGGVLFVASALVLILNGGQPIQGTNLFYSVYMLLAGFLFFAWFWLHGGQTLGLRVWGLRLVRSDGGPLTPRHALLRYLGALLSWAVFGLGFLWVLADQERLTWHDRLSGTRIIALTHFRR